MNPGAPLQGAPALRSQIGLAREDGAVTDAEKAGIKQAAGDIKAQSQEFRAQDRTAFHAIVDELRTAIKTNRQPPIAAPVQAN